VPYLPPRPCRHPGCPALVTGQGSRCPQHARAKSQAFDAQRGTPDERGYGQNWRRLRKMVLAENPLCADPFNVHEGRPVVATDVDHIRAKRDGGTDDVTNLQSLCHACHSRKTAAEVGWAGGGG
jgi:5-methylcytosine-specific restriction protein A